MVRQVTALQQPFHSLVSLSKFYFVFSHLTAPRMAGNSVMVYGSISPLSNDAAPVTSYNLDGITTMYSAQVTNLTQYQVQFYHNPSLSNGNHTLVITNQVETAHFWLDYILYNVTDLDGGPLPSKSSSAPVPAQTSGPVTAGKKSTTSTGAVVGGTISGVLVIVGLAVLFFVLHRRKKRKSMENLSGHEPVDQRGLFVLYFTCF